MWTYRRECWTWPGARTAEAGLPILFHQQDAAELDLGSERFDAVVCLFDSLNYILEPERLQAAFARVFAHLRPGGTFIFDVNTEYALAEGMFNQSCIRGRTSRCTTAGGRAMTPKPASVPSAWTFPTTPATASAQSFSEVHRQRAYGKEELGEWLREAGFDEVVYLRRLHHGPAEEALRPAVLLCVKPNK